MNPSLLPWAACLVVSVVAPICGAAWLLVHRLHARSKNSVIDSGNSLIASVSLFLVGAFAIVAPIAFLSEEGLAGVLTATYYVLELVTIQLINVGEAAVLDSMGAFGYVYYCVLEAYRIAAPLLALTAIVSIVASKMPFLRLMALPTTFPSGKRVFLFYGINSQSLTLAESVLGEDKNSYVALCNISQSDKDKWSTDLHEMKERFGGRFLVVSQAIEAIRIRPGRQISELTYVIFSSDYSGNVSKTLRMRELLAAEGLSHISDSRIRIICRHHNLEDELIFDSSWRAMENGNDSVADIELVDDAQLVAFWLLTQSPLFTVLEATERRPRQKLLISIVGLGELGLTLLKTTFWVGRMLGVDIRIIGYDVEATRISSRLKAECPDMMSEHDGVICKKDGSYRTVHLEELDVFGDEFKHAFVRDCSWADAVYVVVALRDDNKNLEMAIRIHRLLEGTAALSAESKSSSFPSRFNVVFRVRDSEIRRSVEYLTESSGEQYNLTPFGDTETIFSHEVVVENPISRLAMQIAASYQRVWSRSEGDQPFEQLSYNEVLREYRKYEVKKLSSFASALHVPYRLWSVGLALSYDKESKTYQITRQADSQDSISAEDWLRILNVPREEIGNVSRRCLSHEEKQLYSRAYPTLFALADLEHDRWVAFYQSLGWLDMDPADFSSVARYIGLDSDNNPHQSEKLKIHCFACDKSTMLEREAKYSPCKDVGVYDRAIVVDSFQIVEFDVIAADRSGKKESIKPRS